MNLRKVLEMIFLSIVLIFILAYAILVFKVIDYSILAIASDSMKDYINKGDTVIYEMIDISKVKENDVIVFVQDEMTIIHRVVGIKEENGEIVISTKGDNNDNVDAFPITKDNFIGRMSVRIRFIGWPAVLINELLN